MNSRSEWTSIGSCQDHKNLELFESESASLSKQARNQESTARVKPIQRIVENQRESERKTC